MTQPLFDISKCDVPFVQSVDFRFVSECSIKPPPPPIFDCPEPPKTFRIVPECPSIDGSVTISAGAAGCITPRRHLTVTKTPRCGGNEEAGCNFFIDLDLAIPVPTPPCPSIAGDISVTTFQEGCRQPKNSIRIRPKKSVYKNCDDQKSKPGCLFDIDLKIDIPIPTPPCPSIKGGSITAEVFFQGCKPPKNSIKVKQLPLPQSPCSDSQKPKCYHTIDIDIDIPIPRPPCPSIAGGSLSLAVTLDACKQPSRVKVRKRALPPPDCADSQKPNCAHTIDIDLTIPVPLVSCPLISITNNPDQPPAITRKKVTAANCDNALRPPRCEFTINIPPPPCPEISKGSFSVKMTKDETSPSGALKTRKLQPKSGSSCRFAIDIDLKIPVPPCPEISKGSFSVKMTKDETAPSGALKTRKLPAKPGSSCRFAIDIDLKIPVPPCPEISKGSFSIKEAAAGEKPSGALKTRKLPAKPGSSCRFAIDIDLKIPVPPCPEISKGSFNVADAAPGEKPSGALKTRKLPAKPGSSCRFAIDIDLKIPVPPCPEISQGSFSIKDAAAGEKPSGALKTRKLQPKSGSSCRFAIDIDLKIPVPPCPEISKGSFSIKEAAAGEKPSGALKTRKLAPKSGSSCRFAIDIDLKIPVPPCPEISKGSFSIKEAAAGEKPSGALKTRKLPAKPGSSCRFAIDIDLKIPVPPCPEISKGSFSIKEAAAGEKPSGALKTRKLAPKSGSSCRFAIDIDLKIPVPPCPEISKGSFSIKEALPGEKPSGALKTRKLPAKPGSSCRFAIDIDLKIPVPPCPEISKGSFSVKMTKDETAPSGALKTRKLPAKPGSSCRFAIDIDLKIPVPPCPEISKGSFSVKMTKDETSPSGALKTRKLPAKPGSSCRFAIDIDLKIPVPPCPEISKGSFSVKMTKDETAPSGALKTRKLPAKPGSSCRFAIDIDLKIPVPPCPEISKGSFSIKEAAAGEKPSGALKTRKLPAKPGSSCRFAIDIDLKIPVPPCPEISKGSFSIKEALPGEKPSGALKTRKLPAKPGSSCRFAIDIDLKIPVPPCPEISKGSFSVKMTKDETAPSGALKTRKLPAKPGSSCRFAIDIDLKIPVPPCPEISKGSFSIKEAAAGEKPSGALKTRKLPAKPGSSCRFAIDIDLKIPVPPCPEISKGSFSIKEALPGEKPSGALKTRKLPAKPGSSCRFAIDIDLKIPVPPCPEISKGSFSVKMTKDETAPSGALKTRKLPAKPGSSCRFAIDIDLKIPVPPCPEISKGSFKASVADPDTYTQPSGFIRTRRLPAKNGSSCRYAIDFDLKVPVPEISCPLISIRGPGAKLAEMTRLPVPNGVNSLLKPGRCKYVIHTSKASVRVKDGQFTRVACTEKDSIKIKVEKEVNAFNYTYALTPQIWVRKDSIPVVKKGTVTCGWTACDASPTCIMDIRREATACNVNWYIDLDIKIPQPPTYTGGTIDLGGYGTGNINVTGNCDKTIAATITLNTTNCP